MRSSPVSDQQQTREAEGAEAPDQPGAPRPDDTRPDLQAEMALLDDRYKRAVADLDNYRKRATREIDRRALEAADRIVLGWLEVVDSVERALRMDDGGGLREGLHAVLEQMESVLARQGIQRIGEVGERFDPERHEAIDVRTTDEVEDRTVVDVVRSGYARGSQVLRPAQVAVSRRPPAAAGPEG
jgi:molecular chaperone GrpE